MLGKKRPYLEERALVKKITIKGSQLDCTKEMVRKLTYTAIRQKPIFIRILVDWANLRQIGWVHMVGSDQW